MIEAEIILVSLSFQNKNKNIHDFSYFHCTYTVCVKSTP